MNTIDFTQTGGFPLDQNVLGFMQAQSQLAQQPANFGGRLCIISGCEVTGASVTTGFVAINGEVLPFNGGTISPKVIIVETATVLMYEDGSAKPVQKTRYAAFGDDGVQNNLWANFTRHTLQSLYAQIQDAVTALNTALSAGLDLKSEVGHTHTLPSLGFLKRGLEYIGDTGGGRLPGIILSPNVSVWSGGTFGGPDEELFIRFTGPYLTTTNYLVFVTLLSQGSDFNQDNDVIVMVRQRRVDGFTITLREMGQVAQNLSLMYLIVQA